MRPNLVIVRAGGASLHPGWLTGPGPRNWDLVVSYFGDDPDLYREDDVVRIDSKGPKWPPLQALLQQNPNFIDDYDYVCFPDDDLAMTKDDLNRLFDICHEFDLELAQPSLTANSPLTHPLLIHNRFCRLRFTNFVEVMAPCFKNSLLRGAMPTFNKTRSGWGIDWLWPPLADNPRTGVAIVDDVVMHHTRPIGGPNYAAANTAGVAGVWKEFEAFLEAHGMDYIKIEIHRILLRSGKYVDVKGPSAFLIWLLTAGYFRAAFVSPYRWRLLYEIARLSLRPFKARKPPFQDLSASPSST